MPAPVSHAGLYAAYDRMVADQERELHECHEVRSVTDRGRCDWDNRGGEI